MTLVCRFAHIGGLAACPQDCCQGFGHWASPDRAVGAPARPGVAGGKQSPAHPILHHPQLH